LFADLSFFHAGSAGLKHPACSLQVCKIIDGALISCARKRKILILMTERLFSPKNNPHPFKKKADDGFVLLAQTHPKQQKKTPRKTPSL